MTLTDREILELNELCGAAVDGGLTEAQRARLAALLHASEAARRYYVRAMEQSASLHTYASEVHAGTPDAVVRPMRSGPFSLGWAIALPLAAALALGLYLARKEPLPLEPAPAVPTRTEDFVAQISALKDSQWPARTAAFQPGAYLRKGQRLELNAGYAEITFDSGARVVLEGAAILDLNSAWDATLRRGTLKASVPREAIGFRVSNPAVEVVDLGTEFTMIADGQGAAEVLVLKGKVEASPRVSAGPETILLRENESRRFAASGVSAISDRETKFARFTQPLALERFAPTVNVVHWSFDETAGDVVNANVTGLAVPAADVQLVLDHAGDLATVHSDGRRGRALRFDGRLQARGRFPGISGSAARTVAFWVKVPVDAQLSDAYAMVTWATNVKKLGNRPVGISWNRRPSEGPIGALRTDFGGGHAMGSTSLRDGRWHHVAVYFAPGEDPDAPVQVKQYIDGRLESSTIVPGTLRAPAGTGDAALAEVVWLGCRLTGQKQRDHFRGELDELFIADRSLEPQEIVSLMNDNRLPVTALAAVR
ncbi:MAG: hypothetical protein EXS38_06170 [Opitutus sp.]|nr:hypothetical protein [Opitutus sp.]